MSIVNAELHALTADLAGAGVRAAVATRAVVLKGGLNIQKDARQRASGHRHLGAYPFSITTDVDIEKDSIVAEVGPDKNKRQGPLGNLIEYGSANTAPMPHLEPALDAEAPKFETALADVAAKATL